MSVDPSRIMASRLDDLGPLFAADDSFYLRDRDIKDLRQGYLMNADTIVQGPHDTNLLVGKLGVMIEFSNESGHYLAFGLGFLGRGLTLRGSDGSGPFGFMIKIVPRKLLFPQFVATIIEVKVTRATWDQDLRY